VHYFNNNIADFRKDTTHLTLLEQGVYRRLLDQYYLDEKPLCADHAVLMRAHCVRSADERQALENVLQDFFVRSDAGYRHKRCDVEIEAFHAKSSSASESAKARWERVRKDKDASALRPHCDGTANQEPVTTNQQPGKPGAGASQRAARLPADWQPSEADLGFCRAQRAELDPRETAERFRDYWHGVAGSKGCKLDWPATWRNWVRNEKAPHGYATPQIASKPPTAKAKFDPVAHVNRNRVQP